jgi:16S rRNA (cytosine1402-N4)-methyltransferase
LEDRVVKHTFRRLGAGDDSTMRVVTRRPVLPSQEEADSNPRSRSARLRVMEKVA